MVLIPEEAAMTLAELRQMAARQQHQIEAQQQLLVAKEQRLKFLKQQEARHHNLADHQLDTACIQNLRDKIETQELKLRKLRALRGQVEQQKTNNENLGTELDSIRVLFSEKEKELNMAVSKVEELNRQLDDIRNNKNRSNLIHSPTATELDSLKRELLYRAKLSEQQNNYICEQRENIAVRQQDIAMLDKKINELTQRLHRKRLLNEQLASQIHSASLPNNISGPIINNNLYHAAQIVAVEPMHREIIEPEHTQDDMAAKLHGSHKDLGEFSLNKNDPKYQTLPYNTKFTLKGKVEDSLSSTEDDSCPNSLDLSSSVKRNQPSVVKSSNMYNLAPRPFNNSANLNNSRDNKPSLEKSNENSYPVVNENFKQKERISTQQNNLKDKDTANNNVCTIISVSVRDNLISSEKNIESTKASNSRLVKPVVPPKPALPVKPMISNRQPVISIKDTDSNDKDVLNVALSVLQNKSSKNDKNAIRYQNNKENKESVQEAHPSSKSKIATYFKKASQTDSQEIGKGEGPGDTDIQSKRKSSVGQLPIKPKPLTIRKTPGLEPPKLKVQPVVSTNFRKTSESNISSHLKPSYLSPSDEEVTTVRPLKPHESSNESGTIPILEVAPMKIEIQDVNKSSDKDTLTETHVYEQLSVENQENNEACEEISQLELSIEKIDATNIVSESEVDGNFHSAAQRRIRKGNLKGENSTRNFRRVSFDPLALLLDAALEGELELVKKTAAEVPNPSAANDEGITALHNAICAGHVEVVTFLVEFGCDVNAQDSDGWTPLHCAASCNNLPMVKFLIERGACIFATTLSDHETAAEKCEEDEEGFDGCSEYLYSLQENLGVMNNGVVYAVYDYDVQNADELSFKDGDTLIVLRKGDDEESEWWWSRLSDEEGYVPRNLLGLYPRVIHNKDFENGNSTDENDLKT